MHIGNYSITVTRARQNNYNIQTARVKFVLFDPTTRDVVYLVFFVL